MLADPTNNPLPVWHPNISAVQYRSPEPSTRVNVSYYHPDVDGAYAAGTQISQTHPNVTAFLEEELPATHPEVNTLLRAPREHPLPVWHPDVGLHLELRDPREMVQRQQDNVEVLKVPLLRFSPWLSRLLTNQPIFRSRLHIRFRCSSCGPRNPTSPKTFPSSIPRSTTSTGRAGVLGCRTHSSKSSSHQCYHGRTRTSWRCSKTPEPTRFQCGTQMWVRPFQHTACCVCCVA